MMELVPYRNIIIITVVLILSTSAAILATQDQVYDEPIPESSDDGDRFTTDNQNSTNIADVPSQEGTAFGEDYELEDERISYDSEAKVSAPDFLPYLLAVVAYFFAAFMVSQSYFRVVNRPELVRYLNTALKLSGFEPVVSHVGRSWSLKSGVLMEFDGPSRKLEIELPETTKDPREYGFRSSPKPHVSCGLDQVQLTLQSVKLYLND